MAVRLLQRGDIYLTEFSPAQPGEANFLRPAIIVTNNQANTFGHVVVVIPLTSNLDRIYPFDLELPNQRTGLNKDSKAQVNLIRHVSVERLKQRLGFVPLDLMRELDQRIRVHLALH